MTIITYKTISPELEKIEKQIIIEHRDAYSESPSPMKLQKLCYYIQGYSLALNEGKALFNEDFEAWTYGPVIPALYHKYKEYGFKGIEVKLEEIKMEGDPQELIKKIVEIYGRYDGAALSTMTHRESPWIEASNKLEQTKTITKSSMEQYFKALLS